ncbi:MAG: metal ABC transporter permease [Planctomycetes bacterium]|nr:metal ABC transporter permease [Planctomycetota bacterium]
MSALLEPFREPFMRYALAAGLLVAGVSSFLGVFVILKRMVFVGVALAEAAAVGIALGWLAGVDPTLAALAMTFLAALGFWALGRSRIVTKESGIGAGYAIAAGLAVLLVAKNPLAEAEHLDLMEGNLLYAGTWDIVALAAVAAATAVLFGLCYRRILFASFDSDTARSLGLRAGGYELLLQLAIAAAIAASMRVAGVIFTFASLVLPPLAGLLVARSMAGIIAFAIGTSLVSVFAGLSLSFQEAVDVPSGPAIVCIYGVVLIAAASARWAVGRLRALRVPERG